MYFCSIIQMICIMLATAYLLNYQSIGHMMISNGSNVRDFKLNASHITANCRRSLLLLCLLSWLRHYPHSVYYYVCMLLKLAMERDRTKDMVKISRDTDVKLHEELEGAIEKHAQEIYRAQSAVVQVEKDIVRVSIAKKAFQIHSRFSGLIRSFNPHSTYVTIS